MDTDAWSYQGNADMYGLGIRLGFYLQWFAKISADILMRRSEISANSFAIYSFIAAVFIALSIQTAKARITELDGYIVLLLCFGNYYSLVPIFLWRALTCFQCPARSNEMGRGFIQSLLAHLFLRHLARHLGVSDCLLGITDRHHSHRRRV
ncbi:hypothetical protein V8F06_013469 [Rhypophila decipiens]